MRFGKRIAEHQKSGLVTLAYVFAAAFLLALLYRILLGFELKQIYPAFPLSAWAIVQKSIWVDCAVAVFIAIPAVAFLWPLSRRGRRMTLSALSLMVILYGALLAAALLFVTIFEAPFQTSFFGQSLGTFKNAMFTSALSELSLIPLRKAVPLLIAVLALVLGLVYSKFMQHARIKKIIILTTVSLFLLSSLVGLTAPPLPAGSMAGRFEYTSVALNPLSHWLSRVFEKNQAASVDKETKASVALSKKSPLSRFDTDSKRFSRIYPRIPFQRGANYNIVLYFLESTSEAYTHLKYKNQFIMPNLRKLSERAFVAEHHYANFPLSINTFYTVLTSAYQYPDKNFIPCSNSQIRVESIYETLKRASYRTGVFHGSSLENFCRRDYLRNRSVDRQVGFEALDKKEYPPLDKTWQADDRAMIKPVMQFLKEKSKAPAFAVVMPISPHHPYLVPEERFNIAKDELSTGEGRKQQYWLQYVNSLHFSDFVLGEFMAALEKNGLAKNTIVFIFGDHGEAFYQHPGNYLHSLFVYEENIHVPFLIVNPKLFPQKIRYAGISRMIDIAPMVLDIAGIDYPPHYQGISLLSAHRQQFALVHAQWADDILGIVDGENKYIYHVANGFEELYNLASDSAEKTNTAASKAKLANEYRMLLLDGRAHANSFYSAIYRMKH